MSTRNELSAMNALMPAQPGMGVPGAGPPGAPGGGLGPLPAPAAPGAIPGGLAPAAASPLTAGPPASVLAGKNVPRQLIQSMQQQHSAAQAKLDKMQEISDQASAVSTQLKHLTTLGDLVTEEDVVKSASKIVAAGVPAMSMATLLADMPSGQEALSAWIAGQAQQFQAKEAQIQQLMGVTRYETGLAALRLLSAESFGEMSEPFAGAPAGSNPLMPGTPGLAPAPLGIDNSAPGIAPGADLMEGE